MATAAKPSMMMVAPAVITKAMVRSLAGALARARPFTSLLTIGAVTPLASLPFPTTNPTRCDDELLDNDLFKVSSSLVAAGPAATTSPAVGALMLLSGYGVEAFKPACEFAFGLEAGVDGAGG